MMLFFWRGCSSNSSSAGSRLNYCSSVTSDSGCLDYRMNLESVLCPCLKKDCLGLEEWRVLERAQRDNPYVRVKDCQQPIRLHHYISADLLFKSSLLWTKSLQATWRKKRFPPRIVGLLLCSAGDLFPLTIPRWRWGMRILQGNSSPPLGNRPSPISVRRFPEPSKEDKGSKNATLHQNRRKAAAIVALTFRGSHSALFGSLSRS